MKDRKPPALTSPWKIGFFVSLLLVAVSIGVGFFITRAFDVSWTWIEFPDGSWRSWAFNMDGFLKEMLPLAVLVPVFSLFSFVLIAGAVRKYKAYLDSGQDYKNLVKSLSRIHDLEDEKPIKQLKNHPELKDFLLGLRDRIQAREKELNQKEQTVSETAHLEANESVRADANAIVNALSGGRDGFGAIELNLANEQLAAIANAIRQCFASEVSPDSVIGEAFASARDTLRREAQGLAAQLHEIRGELATCNDEASEIEAAATRARSEVDVALSTGGSRTVDAAQALGGLDTIAQSLITLSDAAKSLAINAATQASSSGNRDMVDFAESLRDIAAKFNGTAEQLRQTSGHLKKGFDSGGGNAAQSALHAVGSLAGQISNWVERTVVLTDKFRGFESSHEKATSRLDVTLGGEPPRAAAAAPSVDVEFTDSSVDVGDIELTDNVDDFVRQTPERILDDEPVTDSPDIEKDPDPVAEVVGEMEIDMDTEMFDDIPDTPDQMFEEMDSESYEEPESEFDDADEDTYDHDDGFVMDPAVAGQRGAQEAAVEADEESASFQSTTMDADEPEEEDVVDLYALGAVDFE